LPLVRRVPRRATSGGSVSRTLVMAASGGHAALGNRFRWVPAVTAYRAGVTMGEKVPAAREVGWPRERRCGPLAGFLSTRGTG
jgi:hypothetical protein